MAFINVNGAILEKGTAFMRTDNHSYRYGDGLFETMKVAAGKILLSDLHFQRLFTSLSVLKLKPTKFLTPQNLQKQIIQLCKKNDCETLARVRLSLSGGNGGLYDGDETIQYLIECSPLDNEVNKLNENGLVIDVYNDAKKSCDAFANLKSASHLPYVMASRFAKENKLNDCLLLNSYNRICDSTIANIFWIRGTNILTPPLSEGCIAGVMRAHVIKDLKGMTYTLQETHCEINDLQNADEIFLTNAIQGIRWVKQLREKNYMNAVTAEIYRQCMISS